MRRNRMSVEMKEKENKKKTRQRANPIKEI